MGTGELRQVDGKVAGAWVLSALADGFGGLVKQQVPQRYAAYARIFHPTTDEAGEEVTWAEVARRLGTTAHREMQWHAIVGSYDYSNFSGSRWPGSDPSRSELEAEKMDGLAAILARHTDTAEECFFGLSTIRGGVAEEFDAAPRFELPYREFVILAGPLAAINRIQLSNRHFTVTRFYREGEEPPADYEPPERFWREAPNLIWPADRAWFLATEYDFDSTLLGGSRELIDAILTAPDLEAWEVDGEVSLQADADELNPVPDPPPGFDEPRDPDELQRSFFEENLATLRGEIATVAIGAEGLLEVAVDFARGGGWRLEAANCDWSPGEPAALAGETVEGVDLDPDTGALEVRLANREPLELRPRARAGDADPPDWLVELPIGMKLKHGPGLLFELPDEPTP
jgi:hypothetical protein